MQEYREIAEIHRNIENNERKSSRILHNLEHTRDTIVRENRETYRENIIPLMRYK